MSWRTVVITGHAKLDYKLDYLVVRKVEDTARIHISEIHTLLIESTSVSLTTMLISELNKRKIKVIFCDEKHNPQSELLPYYGSHDTSIKLRNQLGWDNDFKDLVWTEIVSEKIRQQATFLDELKCIEQANLLREYIVNIEVGDVTNREGHAAKVYFNALFGLEFTRTSDEPINAALNYGYSIILSCFNREIVASGYLTQLGLFHDNMFNQFNLSCDFMEPFRVLIDRHVISLCFTKFEHEEKMKVLEILSHEIMIDGKRQLVSNAIRIYCHSLFDALNEKDLSQIKFYKV